MNRSSLGSGVLLALAASVLSAVPAAASAPVTAAGPCPAVHLVYARASNEPPGTANLGNTGQRFSRALKAKIGGVSYAATGVDYAAARDQSSAGPGGTQMTRQVQRIATACPSSRIVLGGGSQGATVTAIALGVRTEFGNGEAIPASLRPRIAAVVVFGNPVRRRQGPIDALSPTYAARTLDLCAAGDPICDPRGTNPFGHYSYLWNGSVDRGAAFAAARVTRTASASTLATETVSPRPVDSRNGQALPIVDLDFIRRLW